MEETQALAENAADAGQMRLFFALWPDDATRAALMRLQSGLSGRRTAYGNLHVTLAFLGRQPAAHLPVLRSMLHALPGREMMLEINRLGYFPRNRIAWAGMDRPPEALLELHRALAQALQAGGIAFDAHGPFRPHITLVRNADAPEDKPFEPIHWMARDIALVQSDMQARGVAYRVMEMRRFKGDLQATDR